MSELPNSWVVASLGEISHVEMGQSPESRFYNDRVEGLPFFQGKAEFGALYPTVRKWCSEPTKIAEAGDILLSVRAPVGPTNLAKEKCCIGRGLAAIRADEPVSQKYLLHYLRHIQSWLSEQGTGTTFTAVSGNFLRALKVTVAPTNEQKRIADKLDAVLARVDACRERLYHVPAILKHFRQAVLTAATSGKLTEEWRNLPGESICSVRVTDLYSHTVVAPESWRKTTFEGVCDLIGGSQPPKSTFVTEESDEVVRLIQIRDYKSDKFKVFIPRKLARRFCSKTDVMIGRYGPPIFQILRGLEGAYNVALMKAEPKSDEIDRDYLFYWLKGETLLRYVESASDRTAGQDGVRKELLNPYPFFLPSKNEQHEIVRRVEVLFAYADRLESRYTAARTQVEGLAPALLAKAFRGELVPQNPNDEPASVLLERIRAVRAEQPTEKRGRKPPAARVPRTPKEKAAMTKSRHDDDVQHKPYLAGLLREAGGITSVEDLFRRAELPVTDFYKQLTWEVENGHIRDDETRLEAA